MKKALVSLIGLGWVCFVSFYYLSYNPIHPSLIWQAWGQPLWLSRANYLGLCPQFLKMVWTLCLVLGCVALAYSLGRKTINGLLGYAPSSSREELVIFTGAGFGVLSFLMLGLGLCGLYFTWLFYLVPLAGLAVLVMGWHKGEAQELVGGFSFSLGQEKTWSRWLMVLVCLTLAISFLCVFVPDTEFDALNYHLAGPQDYLMHHKIYNKAYLFYMFNPFFSEMLNTLGQGLYGQTCAKGFNFVFYLLLFLLLAEMGENVLGRSWAFLPGLFFTIPLCADISSRAFTDMNLVFWETLLLWKLYGFFWAEDGQEEAEPVQAGLLLALFAGFAMSAKYTGAVSFVLAAAGLALAGLASPVRKKMLAGLLVFLAVSLAIVSPWLIKNYVWSGNPVFIFLYDKLGGMPWSATAENILKHSEYADPRASYNTWTDYLTAPWQFIIHQRGTTDRSSQALAFLAFLPLLFFVRSKKRIFYFSLVAGAVFLSAWFVTYQNARILLPAFPWLCLACAYLIHRLQEPGGAVQKIWGAVLVLLICVSVVLSWQETGQALVSPGAVWAGAEPMSAYLSRALPFHYYDAMANANEMVPPDKKILVLGDDRSFYLDRLHCNSSIYYPFFSDLLGSCADKKELGARLKQYGAAYLLYNRRSMEQLQRQLGSSEMLDERSIKLWADFWRESVRVVWSLDGEWCLAEILEEPGEPAKGLVFLPGAEEKLCQEAMDLEQEGHRGKASLLYEKALQTVPDLVLPQERLVFYYLQEGELAKAREHAGLAVKYGSTQWQIWHDQALFLLKDKKFSEALAAAKRVTELAPQGADGYYDLGLVFQRLGRFPEAREAFFRAIQWDPNRPEFKERFKEVSVPKAKQAGSGAK